MTMQAVSNLVFRSVTPRDIRHLQAPDFGRLQGLAAAVCRQMGAEFQLVPPIVLHHALPRVMAGLWAASREAYVADRAGRGLREAVGAGVSQINQCPYCVDVHVAMLHGLGAGDAARALSEDGAGAMDDDMQRAVAWARATLTPGDTLLRNPPFPAAAAPRIIGTALLFHYLNRMVHLFLPPSPLPIPASFGWLKRNAGTLFGRTVGRSIVTLVAGAAPFPLADEAADLPAEFAWAQADPRVAAAFALFAMVAAEAGAAHVDAEVRALVDAHLARWRGEAPGLGRAWAEQAVADLPVRQRPAGRLALLTALASYQVTDADITAFRAQDASDAALVGATSWVSFRAMQRIAGWLHAPLATAPISK